MRLTLPLLTLLLAGAGWRTPSDATPALPTDWTHEHWSTAVPDGSWSTPVVFDGKVYVTAEPTRLLCLDLETGAILWERDHPIDQLLDAEEKATFEARKERAAEVTAELATLREQEAQLRRDIRRDKAKRSDLAPVRKKLEALRKEQDAFSAFFTPPRTDGLGYAVPTPHVDADGIIAAFGTGAVVALNHDGSPRWHRWLGVAEPPTHGYHGTDTASVLRHGNTVLVTHGSLHALDHATGTSRWTGPAYRDYGTPGIVDSEAGDMVLTPDGHVLDLNTGTVLTKGLGALWYLGPTVRNDQVWWVGRGDAAMDKPVKLRRTTLTRDGTGVHNTTTLELNLPAKDRQYAHPVFVDDTMVVVTAKGSLMAVDAEGTVTAERSLELKGQVWTNPTHVGDHLVITTHEGEVLVLEAKAPFAVVSTATVPTEMAKLAFVGSTVVSRDADGVHRRGK